MFSFTTILKNGFNFKTFAQIVLPAVITFILFVVSIFQFAFPKLEQIFIERKKEMIRELTQTVISELANFKKDADSGVCTVDQAKHLAGEHIRNIRYGEEKKDYFWIIDTYPNMIIHPFLTGLENTSLREYTDPDGKKLFVEMVKAVEEDGYGYVDYMWQWKDNSTKIVQKLSYVQGFEPWGWILGTGIYIEDVYRELSVIRTKFVLLSIMILGLVSFPLIYIVRNGILQEKRRYLTQLQLVESENKYRTIVENAGTAVIISENDKSISFVNSEFETLSGWFRDEVEGRYWTEIFDGDEIEKMSEYHRLRRKDPTKVPKKYESKLYNKAGELKTVLVTVELIPETLRSIISLRDISEQKKAEEALKESEEKYSKAFYSSPDSLTITDIETGHIIEVNAGFEKVFGYSYEESLNRTTLELNLWADPTDGKKILSILRKDNRVKEFYSVARKKSGEIIDIEISMEYVEIKGKKYILTIARDITERKEAEAKLLRWANVFKYAEWGVAICNSDGLEIEMMNPALFKILGYSEDELINEKIIDIVAKLYKAGFSEQIRIAHKEGHHTFELELIRQSNEIFPAQVDVTSVKDKNNMVNFLVINIQDISERIKLNQQISSALRLKSMATLSSGIAHEINQPLNSIKLGLGLLELSQEENKPFPVNDILKKYRSLLNDVDRISAIIQHMRTLTKTEVKKKLQSVDVCKVLNKALDLIKTRLTNHGIKLNHSCIKNKFYVIAHELQLEQVIINLVTNAMNILDDLDRKEKWITINYDSEDDYIIFHVEDNGTGLGENASHLFEPFFAGKTTAGGQGLGLSLVHTFVTSWGGKIEAGDNIHGGARFSVWLKKYDQGKGTDHENIIR